MNEKKYIEHVIMLDGKVIARKMEHRKVYQRRDGGRYVVSMGNKYDVHGKQKLYYVEKIRSVPVMHL